MKIRSGIVRLNARKFSLISNSREYILRRNFSSAPRAMDDKYPGRLIERRLHGGLNTSRRSCLLRFYSSGGDGTNAGGRKVETTETTSRNKAQSGTVQQDQNEELAAEKLSLLSTRGERFRDEYLSRIVPWEKIPVSLDNFPYYIHEDAKTLLVECMASHLRQTKFRKYGGRLAYASNRILLQSIPGTGLCRERLVSALARELRVPLLKLDSSIFPPRGFSQDNTFESESDDESSESDDEEDENGTTDEEEDTSSDEESTDDSDEEVDTQTSAETYGENAPAESRSSELLKKGDRVIYFGRNISIKESNRTLSRNQRGEVFEVNGDKVAVIFHINGLATKEAEKDEKSTETAAKALVTWLDVKHVEHDRNAQIHDTYIAFEVLHEVLESQQPIVVYFSDPSFWLPRRNIFVEKLQKMFDELPGRVILISGQNKWEAGQEEMEKFPVSLKKYVKRLKAPTRSEEYRLRSHFTNVMFLEPPKDQDLLNTFINQIEEDRRTLISEGNLCELHKVLKEHDLLCMNLEHANIDDMILTRQKAQKVVGWATNHYLSSCLLPCVQEDRLHLPHDSLKLAILRLKEQMKKPRKPSKSIKDLAWGRHERKLVSAVVRPDDIGVKFDDVGALEHVKKALYELVILPMRRPELFSHGNLLRPCKGLLLFGPPGTGKTLISKALATEVGANFIYISSATITSKWYGESEKFTRALFSYASRLAPVIIFVDEVDSLLRARGDDEHDAARLNEFMAAWDGLKSKESERILVLGATNRPFDLDDAVIRRMPRRIYVGLPDVENRSKILKVLLTRENLEPGFSFEQLAEATEGYSGSDLKNLCVAAAYRPVQELLEKESKDGRSDGVPVIRPLNVNDFTLSKSKVGPSVAYNTSSMKKLREWNEQFGEGGSRREPPSAS